MILTNGEVGMFGSELELFSIFNADELDQYILVVLAATLGFISRLLKKFFKDGIHPIDYMSCFWTRTVSSWVTILGTAITTYYTSDMPILDFSDFITYITMAYMADSIVNREPSIEEAEMYRLAQEERKLAKRLVKEKVMKERKERIEVKKQQLNSIVGTDLDTHSSTRPGNGYGD